VLEFLTRRAAISIATLFVISLIVFTAQMIEAVSQVGE